MGRDKEKPKLSLPAQLNVLCDRLTNETAAAVLADGVAPVLPPVLSLPYFGSKALLCIGTRWVTLGHRAAIHSAHWDHVVKEYCCRKYNWTSEVFHSVDWDAIGSVRRRLHPSQFTRTSKIMHDWLPVMHMQAHSTKNSQCPGCAHTDETLDHLFCCKNPRLIRLREVVIIKLQKKSLCLGLPWVIVDTLTQLLQDYTLNRPPALPQYDQLRRAVESQLQIGVRMLPWGFLSKQWVDLLADFSISFPARKMSGFLWLLWLDFVEPLWKARNEIAHQGANLNAQAADSTITDRLYWYLDNPHVVSAGNRRALLSIGCEDIIRMTPLKQATLAKDLDTMRALFSIESQQRASGQSLLTEFFQPVRGIG